MASDDEIRPFLRWYVAALACAVQAIKDDEDAGEVIAEVVDELSESEVRRVLVVSIGHSAEQAVEDGGRE